MLILNRPPPPSLSSSLLPSLFSLPQRFDEAKNELLSLLSEQQLTDSAILVFANKADLPTAIPVVQIAQLLQLDRVRPTVTLKQPLPSLRFVFFHSRALLSIRSLSKEEPIAPLVHALWLMR